MSSSLARRATTPGRHVYDVVVLGTNVSGALCAALLARRGLQVLALEADGAECASYETEGWRLPTEPFLMPSPREAPLLDEGLAELGLASEFGKQARAPAPPLQLLRERARFDLPGDAAARTTEFTRALGPEGGAALGRLLDDVHRVAAQTDSFLGARPELGASGFFGRWRLKRLLARIPGLDDSGPLGTTTAEARLLAGVAQLTSSLARPSGWALARAAGKAITQPVLVPAGRAGLAEFLLARARELGADVLEGADAACTVAFDGGRPMGVRLARGDTTYRAAALVNALDPGALTPLLPADRQKPWLKLSARLEPVAAVFGVSIVVPLAAVPRGLGEFAILEPTDPELRAVFITTSPAVHQGAPRPELRVLQVAAVAPLALRQGGEPALRAFAERLWAEFKTVAPFTRELALARSTAWIDAPTAHRGPWSPRALYQLPPEAPAGVVGIPTEGPWRRHLNVGRAVLPGLGLEGEWLSCLLAVARIEKLLKKNDPLKQKRP